MANVFADLWLIFKAQDIRRHVNQWQNFNNRIDYINFYYQRAIDFKPDCSRFHTHEQGEEIPRDWPHTLHTIYQIRCNLFHGEKSPHSEMDANIVNNAFDVLLAFFIQAELIS